jgi:formylglycine-generating enzyme required for sulfatase activity
MYKSITKWGTALITTLVLLAFAGCPMEPEDSEKTKIYTITYDVNGGTALDPAGKTVTNPPDETLGALPTPTHGQGKIFSGWFTAVTGGTGVTSETRIDSLTWEEGNSITIYALWSDPAITYTITLNPGAGNSVTPTSITRNSDTDTTVGDLPTPTGVSGKTFEGWYTAESSGTRVNTDTTLVSLTWDSGNGATLYAVWTNEVIIYTITLNPGVGNNVNPTSITRSSDIDTAVGTLPTPTHTDTTKIFDGWFTATSGGTQVTATTSLASLTWDASNAVTIYAVWSDPPPVIITYTITLNPGTGNSVTPTSITRSSDTDTAVGTLPTPTHTDATKIFDGWFTAASGGTQVTATTTLASLTWENNGTTLYAKWSTMSLGLVLRYNFTAGGAPDTIADLAGTNPGLIQGSAALGTHNGVNILTTGEDGYVDMGASAGALITAQDEFSLATYIYTDDNVTGTGYDLWSFAASGSISASAGQYTFFRTVGQSSGLSLSGWNNATSTSVSGNLPTGVWRHYIYTQSGNVGKIYIDGVLAMTKSDLTITPTQLAANGGLIQNWIARPCFSGNIYMKNSKFADFRIYDKAIDAADIAALGIPAQLIVLDAGDTTPLLAKITDAQTLIADATYQDAVFGLEVPRAQKWANKTGLAAFINEAQGMIQNGATQTNINNLLNRFNTFSGSGGFGYTMKPVPAGKFQRDDTAENITVITKGYKIGAYEVTQELWEAVMGVNYSFNTDVDNPLLPVDGGIDAGTNATSMHIYQAIVFCNKLSEITGKTPVYKFGGAAIDTSTYPSSGWPSNLTTSLNIDNSANGYRLPTEMEWMWAAMGANFTAADIDVNGVNVKGYKKDFAGDMAPDTAGDSPDNYAWTGSYSAGNGNLGQTWPVVTGNTGGTSGNGAPSYSKTIGTKNANELGLYDMSGNLTEFCIDLTADSYTATDGLWGPGTLTDWYQTTGGRYVVIGGDYGGNYPVTVSRAQWENSKNCANNWAHRYFGFRIVVTETAGE